jgi:hypothetical protein
MASPGRTLEPTPAFTFVTDTPEPTDWPVALDTPQPTPSPMPTVAGRSLSWKLVQAPVGLAVSSDSTLVNSLFAWSGGYLVFHGDLLTAAEVPWTSKDGTSWTQGPPLDTTQFADEAWVEKVVEGPAGLLAMGRYPGCADTGSGCAPGAATGFWTSTDGLHWKPLDLKGTFGGKLVGDVAAGPRGYMAVSDSETGPSNAAIWLSADSRAWHEVTLPATLFQDAHLARATIVDDTYLAAGRTGSLEGSGGGHFPSTTPAIWSSVDGIAWSRATLPGVVAAPEAEAAVTVAGPGKVIGHVVSWDCLCSPEGVTGSWTSGDGRNWTASHLGFPSPAVVLTDGHQAVQVVSDEDVATEAISSDGFKWSRFRVTGSGPADVADAAFGPAGLLVIDSAGALWRPTVR